MKVIKRNGKTEDYNCKKIRRLHTTNSIIIALAISIFTFSSLREWNRFKSLSECHAKLQEFKRE